MIEQWFIDKIEEDAYTMFAEIQDDLNKETDKSKVIHDNPDLKFPNPVLLNYWKRKKKEVNNIIKEKTENYENGLNCGSFLISEINNYYEERIRYEIETINHLVTDHLKFLTRQILAKNSNGSKDHELKKQKHAAQDLDKNFILKYLEDIKSLEELVILIEDKIQYYQELCDNEDIKRNFIKSDGKHTTPTKCFSFKYEDTKRLKNLLFDIDKEVIKEDIHWSRFIDLVPILTAKNLKTCDPYIYNGAMNTLVYVLDEISFLFYRGIKPSTIEDFELITNTDGVVFTKGNYYSYRSKNKKSYPKYQREIKIIIEKFKEKKEL